MIAQADVEPNVVSFSAMIDACAKIGDANRAKYWHQRMVAHGVKPNAHSFSTVINACAKSGELKAAWEQFEEMESAGITGDVVVYSSLVDAYGVAGELELAKDVFNRMKARGVAPNVVAYASLARPFAHKGNWQEVECLAAEMQASGLKSNEYFLYAQLLSYANAKPRQTERAEKLFRKEAAAGLRPNAHVVTALGRALGRGKAAEVLRELGLKSPETSERVLRGPKRSCKPE